MTTEDNFNAPNRSIADWIAEGYTESYAKSLFAQANKRNAISQETRVNILSTIDELNQYLEGNVTLEGLTDAVNDLSQYIVTNKIQ
jgi:prolyl oligopeptidase PreP (S9A serine peptidase family)|tara:strand:- start:184 stop:441 length:258 start_codon:yes stop_codon:yes gene_type:complete